MRVRQSSSFLMTLLREVHAGRMLPAGMQRPYVWCKADVEALCDSIISGFPIGAFLMWAPGAKADLALLAKDRLGPIPPASGAASAPRLLLLDGQNRLATLAWMMQHQTPELADGSPAELGTWLGPDRLVLDQESHSVKFVHNAQADSGLRLPAWTLVCSSTTDQYHQAMALLRERIEGDWAAQFSKEQVRDFLDFWDECRDAFRDARTTETIIEDATAAEARHAFLRICRVGVPMAQEDFDRAVGWSADEIAAARLAPPRP